MIRGHLNSSCINDIYIFYHLLCVCLCVCVCAHVHRMQICRDARYQHQIPPPLFLIFLGDRLRSLPIWLVWLASKHQQSALLGCQSQMAIHGFYGWRRRRTTFRSSHTCPTNTLPTQHLPSSLK